MSAAQQPDSLRPRGLLHRLSGADGLEALHALLRADGFAVSADRWQNVYDLLLALQQRGAAPTDLRRLRPLLAPLFCRGEREQRRFGQLFELWLRGLDGRAGADLDDQATDHPPPLPRPRWGRIAAYWLAALLLLLAAGGAGLWWWQQRIEPVPVASAIATEQPSPATRIAPDGDAQPNLWARPPAALPPRRPLECPRLEAGNRWLLAVAGWLVACLPLLALLPALVRRWVGYGLVLRRRRSRPRADATHRITLDAEHDDLFDGHALRAALRRLHRPVALPTRHLNADASARRTARLGGLFAPVYRVHRRVPDLVALVEHNAGADQLAGLAEQALDRLAAAGLNLIRYQYQGDPRRLIAADGRRIDLGILVHRHAGARLLLIGDLAGLLTPFSVTPQRWLTRLQTLAPRGLLGTRGLPESWRQVLSGRGFCVAELGSGGLEQVVAWLGLDLAPVAPEQAAPPLPIPLREAGRWQQGRPQRDGLARLDQALDDWLGDDGRLLLAAMGAYPWLHWGLTRALDLILLPNTAPGMRERRLLRLARLPWCRAGRLPDWLRRHLLRSLSPARRAEIGACWQDLLRDARIDGNGRVRLPVDLPAPADPRAKRPVRKDLRRWLRREQELAGPGDPLRDRIFAELLFGRRRDPLALSLPPDLAKQLVRLLGPRSAAWLRQALPLLSAALLAMLALRLGWGELVEPAIGDWLLQRQLAPNAAVEVDLWHTDAAHRDAVALADTLRAWGFEVGDIERRALAMPEALQDAVAEAAVEDQTRPRPINAIQWTDPADEPAARQVMERLTRLLWGQAPNKVPPGAELPVTGPGLETAPAAGEVRVLLLTPALERAGYRFDDPLPRPGESAMDCGADPLRDPLKDGGLGPEMIPLPGGTFRMGSPPQEPERDSDEGPQREVRIAPFAIGRTEVSFDDYDRFARATGRGLPNDGGWGRGQRPAINVSWDDAQAYADWLSEQTGRIYSFSGK